jgi:hypothetical protein
LQYGIFDENDWEWNENCNLPRVGVDVHGIRLSGIGERGIHSSGIGERGIHLSGIGERGIGTGLKLALLALSCFQRKQRQIEECTAHFLILVELRN